MKGLDGMMFWLQTNGPWTDKENVRVPVSRQRMNVSVTFNQTGTRVGILTDNNNMGLMISVVANSNTSTAKHNLPTSLTYSSQSPH